MDTKSSNWYERNKELTKERSKLSRLSRQQECKDCGGPMDYRSKYCVHCNSKHTFVRPMLGKHHTETTKQLMSKKASGSNNIMFGKHTSIKQKQSASHPGSSHPNWKGGISFGEYGILFNKELKTYIRKRDRFVCQNCNKNGWVIHHIDYNKQNNDEFNLICLCNKCHGYTQFKREYWRKYYEDKTRIIRSNRIDTKVQVQASGPCGTIGSGTRGSTNSLDSSTN